MKKSSVSFFGLAFTLLAGIWSTDVVAENINWYTFQVTQDKLAPLVDFSALNKRLSEEDRIVAHDGHFYRVGPDRLAGTADDTRIRLMGINLSGAANFPDEAGARQLARRLRRLGFNAVRLHQMDARLSDESAVPNGLLTNSAYPTFHTDAIRRLRNFISVLKEEGIYINLNLHVNYQFRPAVDQVNPLLDGAQMPLNSHPLHLFDPRMISLQAEYARQLIRLLELRNDPVLAMVEISNESSLVGAWQRGELEKLNGDYERTWNGLWQKWILREYGSLELACERWRTCEWSGKGAQYLKKVEVVTAGQQSGWIANFRKFARKILQKIGVPVPAFLQIDYQAPLEGLALRSADYMRFLIEADQQFFETMRQIIRQETGSQVAVTGTQRYFGGVANQLSQQNMDYADEHFYTDHVNFPGQSWSDDDWRIKNSSSLRDSELAIFRRSYFRDRSKPYVLSEFNQAYPNRQAAEIIPAMVTIASLQDWDGLFFFQYGAPSEEDAYLSGFSLNNHSSQLVAMGSLAAVFRRFQMAPLSEQLVVPVSRDEITALVLNGESLDPMVWQDFMRRRFELDGTEVLRSRVSLQTTEPEQFLLRQKTILADTGGALPQFDDRQGNLIWADKFAGFFAGFGDASLLSGWSVQHAPGGRGFAVVTVTSRDGMPLDISRRLLLTVAGASTGSQSTGHGVRPRHLIPYKGDSLWQTLEPDQADSQKPSGSRSSPTPVWMEKLVLKITVPVNGQQVRIFRLDEAGKRKAVLPAEDAVLSNGMLRINAGEDCPWYEIVIK